MAIVISRRVASVTDRTASPMATTQLSRGCSMNEYIAARFDTISNWISDVMGSPFSFLLALSIVITWMLTGPLFGFSDTWQLIINTGTTIVTFLMVFLLQNTGNRTIDEMHERLKTLERQNLLLLLEMRKKNEQE